MRCEHCGADESEWSWADRRFGHCLRRGPAIANTSDRRLGYREDLARFKGDPEANVSSQAGLQKLIDKRQRRDGWALLKKAADIDMSGKRTVNDNLKGRKPLAQRAIEEAFGG